MSLAAANTNQQRGCTYRLGRGNADLLNVRLAQLKGEKAGVSGAEIAPRRGSPPAM
jgi:hypothetical protein